jgi:murein DD-endopeptidase MepM/ murein hydrolase activator NlpD
MNKNQFFFGVSFAGIVVLIFIAPYIFSGEPKPAEPFEVEEEATWIPTMQYGFVIDSLEVIQKKVKRNQNLATILSEYDVDNETIFQLSNASKGVFDVRKIHANKPIIFLRERDSLQTLKAVVYEPSKVEYVVFNMQDSIHVEMVTRETTLVEKEAAGVIKSSLAMSMIDQNLSPVLTNGFADIFAWQIDFFHLYPDDKFKVTYMEEQIDGETIGIESVKSAYFQHAGNDYYAFNFDQGSGFDFFDEEGNSLRKALLRYPVKFSRISSRYSGNRYHPVQKRYKAHRGTDFAAPQGTPIRSVGDGIVEAASYHKYNGNWVKVKHNGNFSTGYLHMVKIASGMRPGTRVKQGQIIGYVGHTGLAKGNHVCFRFWKNGVQVDALKIELPPSEPIKPEFVETFTSQSAQMREELDAITYPADQVVMATFCQ